MSCSVQLKTRSTVKSKKVNNVIHRTTSETIRLGEPEVIINNSSRQVMTALAISPPPLKKSTCSFQITGVSLTQRTDFGGDDSADDLDESHTDDISRVTDNETPSFSEDTCSRDADDNYIGSCSALCSVTVIPSSSQYGLAIVPSETSAVPIGNFSESSFNSLTSKASASTSVMSDITETQTSSSTKEEPITTAAIVPGTGASPTTASAASTSVTATTTFTTPSSSKEKTVKRSARFPGTRFEVVKVETIQPFRRGRWTCVDYLDDSKYTPKNALTYKSPDSAEITCTKPQPQYTMTATTTEIKPTQGNADFGTTYMNTSTNQGVVQQNVQPVAAQQGQVYNAQLNQYYSNIVRQSQSYSTPISVPTQQLHHDQIDVTQAHSFIRQSSVPEAPRTQVSNFALQNQYFQNLPMGTPTAQAVQQPGNTSVAPQQQSNPLQQPNTVPQNMTLPCQPNQGQFIPGDMYGTQNSQMYYAQVPLNQPVYISQAAVYISPSQIATPMQNFSNLVESGQNQNIIYSDQTSGTAEVMTGSFMQQNYTSPQTQGQSIPTAATQQYSTTPVNQQVMTGSVMQQNYTAPQAPDQSIPTATTQQYSTTPVNQQVMTGSVMQQNYTAPQAPDQSIPTPTAQQYSTTPVSQSTTAVGDSYQVSSPGFSGKRSDSSDSHSSGQTSRSSTRKSSLEPVVEDVPVVATQAQNVQISSVTSSVPSSSAPILEQAIASTSRSTSYGTVATVSAVQPSTSGLESSSANVPATVPATSTVPVVSSTTDSEGRYHGHVETPYFQRGKRCSFFLSFFFYQSAFSWWPYLRLIRGLTNLNYTILSN